MEVHVEEKEDSKTDHLQESSLHVSYGVVNDLPEDASYTKKRKGMRSVLIKQEERETVLYKHALGGLWVVMVLFTCYTVTEVLPSFKQHMVKFLDRSNHVKELCTWILHSYICKYSFNWSGIVSTLSLWAIMPLLILFHAAYLFYQSTSREVKRLDSITRSPVYAQFGEALNGLSSIRAYQAYDRTGTSFRSRTLLEGLWIYNNIRFTLVKFSSSHWLDIRLETLGGIMIWVIATFGVMQNGKAENQVQFASTVGTVRFNLDPFSEHNDADLWEALERAHLKDVIRRNSLILKLIIVLLCLGNCNSRYLILYSKT
ncbi:putative xenobiotic-transporting ATPase [Rosa chinensis]|uniref:Putative xenobiotic-transporting ATPase n=1 Tax=Rosa chinensis TaxID=74649 RepID=A0A2P6RGC9_ROSCH|nr:putative xenobiotic-transporting ATPase [Rosa chinensis]